MTRIDAGVVDVLVVNPYGDAWRVLALKRATGVRCPGSWETVHGSIEAGELPADAALRELREETGLEAERLYNVTTHAFYLHRPDLVEIAIVFCAFVREAPVTTGQEHVAAEWLTRSAATERFAWPSERASLTRAWELLSSGDAGPLEDVLRVR